MNEIIDEKHPFLDPLLDPKANWAINNLDSFPVEVNTAPYEMLLRVPGIGVRGAKSIVRARKRSTLREPELRKLGIAYKRARYFITCNGSYAGTGADFSREGLRAQLAAPIQGRRHGRRADKAIPGQLSLFEQVDTTKPKIMRPGEYQRLAASTDTPNLADAPTSAASPTEARALPQASADPFATSIPEWFAPAVSRQPKPDASPSRIASPRWDSCSIATQGFAGRERIVASVRA